MKIKNFLRPTLLKVVIFIIFLLITVAIPKIGKQCNMMITGEVSCMEVKTMGIGYPVFYGEIFAGDVIDTKFHPDLFILNIVTFYLTSCLFLFIFGKFRNK